MGNTPVIREARVRDILLLYLPEDNVMRCTCISIRKVGLYIHAGCVMCAVCVVCVLYDVYVWYVLYRPMCLMQCSVCMQVCVGVCVCMCVCVFSAYIWILHTLFPNGSHTV